ncbi:unnamed protein product [Cyprideis torosa]|uniref:Sec16 Sec23-binding domain-containing protein n=1 Tax=Cyprideis torosa TaxID=163714 RepID=A0A7R8WAN5_9CRUS|nr:unnamed protein product [Cyprideis torosa]CAG0886537.1 unnamed protein product [Cyprideis torosa]
MTEWFSSAFNYSAASGARPAGSRMDAPSSWVGEASWNWDAADETANGTPNFQQHQQASGSTTASEWNHYQFPPGTQQQSYENYNAQEAGSSFHYGAQTYANVPPQTENYWNTESQGYNDPSWNWNPEIETQQEEGVREPESNGDLDEIPLEEDCAPKHFHNLDRRPEIQKGPAPPTIFLPPPISSSASNDLDTLGVPSIQPSVDPCLVTSGAESEQKSDPDDPEEGERQSESNPWTTNPQEEDESATDSFIPSSAMSAGESAIDPWRGHSTTSGHPHWNAPASAVNRPATSVAPPPMVSSSAPPPMVSSSAPSLRLFRHPLRPSERQAYSQSTTTPAVVPFFMPPPVPQPSDQQTQQQFFQPTAVGIPEQRGHAEGNEYGNNGTTPAVAPMFTMAPAATIVSPFPPSTSPHVTLATSTAPATSQAQPHLYAQQEPSPSLETQPPAEVLPLEPYTQSVPQFLVHQESASSTAAERGSPVPPIAPCPPSPPAYNPDYASEAAAEDPEAYAPTAPSESEVEPTLTPAPMAPTQAPWNGSLAAEQSIPTSPTEEPLFSREGDGEPSELPRPGFYQPSQAAAPPSSAAVASTGGLYSQPPQVGGAPQMSFRPPGSGRAETEGAAAFQQPTAPLLPEEPASAAPERQMIPGEGRSPSPPGVPPAGQREGAVGRDSRSSSESLEDSESARPQVSVPVPPPALDERRERREDGVGGPRRRGRGLSDHGPPAASSGRNEEFVMEPPRDRRRHAADRRDDGYWDKTADRRLDRRDPPSGVDREPPRRRGPGRESDGGNTDDEEEETDSDFRRFEKRKKASGYQHTRRSRESLEDSRASRKGRYGEEERPPLDERERERIEEEVKGARRREQDRRQLDRSYDDVPFGRRGEGRRGGDDRYRDYDDRYYRSSRHHRRQQVTPWEREERRRRGYYDDSEEDAFSPPGGMGYFSDATTSSVGPKQFRSSAAAYYGRYERSYEAANRSRTSSRGGFYGEPWEEPERDRDRYQRGPAAPRGPWPVSAAGVDPRLMREQVMAQFLGSLRQHISQTVQKTIAATKGDGHDGTIAPSGFPTDLSSVHYEDSPEVAKKPVLKARPIYDRPHPIVRFSANNRLVLHFPFDNRDGSGRSVVLQELRHSIQYDSEVYAGLKHLPGPFTRSTNKLKILEFLRRYLGVLSARSSSAPDAGLASEERLLWSYLSLLIQQNGSVLPADIAQLVLSFCDQESAPGPGVRDRAGSQGTTASGASSLNRDEHNSTAEQSAEAVRLGSPQLPGGTEAPPPVEELTTASSSLRGDQAGNNSSAAFLAPSDDNGDCTRLLLHGRKDEALAQAVAQRSWGHALLIAGFLGDATYKKTISSFLASMESWDPLRTFYEFHLGRIPPMVHVSGEAKFGDWKRHLAVIVANSGTTGTGNECQLVERMGDSLLRRGRVHGAHLCYLIANAHFGLSDNPATKLTLIGANQASQRLNPTELATAILATELYEYGVSLNQHGFYIPHLAEYKFRKVGWLLDIGFSTEALDYLECISRTILAMPQYFPDHTLACQVESLAHKLKTLSGVWQETLTDPDWLTLLGYHVTNTPVPQTFLQDASAAHTPEDVPDTAAAQDSYPSEVAPPQFNQPSTSQQTDVIAQPSPQPGFEAIPEHPPHGERGLQFGEQVPAWDQQPVASWNNHSSPAFSPGAYGQPPEREEMSLDYDSSQQERKPSLSPPEAPPSAPLPDILPCP